MFHGDEYRNYFNFDGENGSNTLLEDVSIHLPIETASHPRIRFV
jgi:hypothetical protein